MSFQRSFAGCFAAPELAVCRLRSAVAMAERFLDSSDSLGMTAPLACLAVVQSADSGLRLTGNDQMLGLHLHSTVKGQL